MTASDPIADRLSAVRDWLIVERAYEQGRASDADLHRSQDRITGLLGPRAIHVAIDFLGESDDVAASLGRLIGDRARLGTLLGRIEDERRPGFESRSPRPENRDDLRRTAEPTGWSRPPEAVELHVPRRVALLVMAEYGVEDPVWDRPFGDGGPVALQELGVNVHLIQQLRDWNDIFAGLALTDFEWASPQAKSAWADEGLRLAYLLQNQLPDISIRYCHHGDDRPLRG